MVNLRIKLLYIFGFMLCIFLTENLFSQRFEKGFKFDSIYIKGIEEVNSDISTSKKHLKKMEYYKKLLTPIQQAQTNYLRLKIIYADTNAIKALEKKMFAAPDSLAHYDALVFSARKFLERSMPDKAIRLLMEALDAVKTEPDKADYCKINLCEAYRQKQEYYKGIEMLNELLYGKRTISDINRAYACNRLAAIYDEWGSPRFNRSDSVEKYSYRCISVSEKINSKANLALSQNELSYLLGTKKKYDKALELSVKAIRNFHEAGMFYSEMNALINQSNIYIDLKEYKLAFQAVNHATNLCAIEENRNLFMRLYLQFSSIYKLTGDYKNAYAFLSLSRMLQEDFYKDRISTQINEQSAKYDLLTKEQKIKVEEQKNEFRKKQLTFLILILVFLCIAFALSLLYFRLKRKEFIKQKLIEAVIETEEKERKRIASDLHDGLGPVLSAVNLYFQAYLDAKENQKPEIENQLKIIIENAIADVSRISHNISPHILEKYGLIIALENFIDQISLLEKVKIFTNFEKISRFDLKTELTIYRTITELFNNTIKHAFSTEINLKIYLSQNIINIDYSDNGKGFDVIKIKQSKKGMGLHNILNRINSLNGKISIISSEISGTKVQMSFPYYELSKDEN